MNKFNPKKLLSSKWTAVTPVQKEKHFIVVEVEFKEDGSVESLSLEAVISKRSVHIAWQDLKNANRWEQGWK